jgi:hypothetical protein
VPDLQIDADLRIHVTAPTGRSATGRVTARGSEVRVEVDRPHVLLASFDRSDVGRLADLLADAGLSVQVVGPRGPAGVIGSGASSRVGRWVTGSAAVSPAPLAALRSVPGSPTAWVGGLAVLAVLVGAGWRRRVRRS